MLKDSTQKTNSHNNKASNFERETLQKVTTYKSAKKLRYYDYLIVLVISLSYIGLTFLIDHLINKSTKNYWEYLITSGFIVLSICWVILGLMRSRMSLRYHNNKLQRYQPTFSPQEGLNRRISKIVLLISLVLLMCSIVLWTCKFII
ncbi:hypothetical protein EELLY_v1c04270 [Entomoplasma ellychniae]|uniref:Uncharacterized protein n=1 Tax=Entomoplasma ellychniae TaxID=2114 RepID=A0A8E2QW28_9MOLU|nr:hypothetical protein [Entomoplasma ellychniae]PPE04747.1 hypothetical protein EELLY_v1c04270 [Entomoplasma ellychniae]